MKRNCETEKQKPFRYFMSLKRPVAGGESCKQDFFLLHRKNYLISMINLIKSGYGISFVYEVLAKSGPELGLFTLKGEPIIREFNVIYLKHADVREKMEWFL